MVAHVEQLFAKASESHSAGLWSEAEALYRSILTQEPGHAPSLHRLGLLAHQSGDQNRAVSLIQEAIALQPGEAAFYGSLGAVLLALGRHSEALAAFEREVSLTPGSATVRNNFAYALHVLGFSARAVSEYEQALTIAPDNAEIRNNFAQVLVSQGQLDLAVENFRKVIAATGGSAQVYATLGNALYGLKRFPEAVDAYKSAIVLAPNIADIHKNLGIALHRMNARQEARTSFETAARIAPNERKLVDLAETYAALGQMQAGLDAFYGVLRTSPDHEWLHGVGDDLSALGFHSAGIETISQGPGMIQLSLAGPRAPATPRVQRIDMVRPSTPNFVGCWMMSQPEICDRLVAFFEAHATLQAPGRTSAGVDTAVKRSIDISIVPKDLAKPAYGPLNEFVLELESCLQDYGRQWPHLAQILPSAALGPFNIQKYQEGGHFQVVHSERMVFKYIHRVLAWMTYLNDVEAGGETAFPQLGLAIKPQRGKTLIWPAEWTHAHRGEPVIAGTKYVVTGWFHFPHPREPDLLSTVVR